MPRKITPEEYREIFKNCYPDYELLSDYSGDKKYIRVRCKIDGYEWDTKPNWLKHGSGCKKCYYRRSSEAKRKKAEEFIRRAKEKHGDKYDYSKVNYLGNKIPVTLICPEHGEFDVRPDKHLSRGDGCPICANIQNGLRKRLPLSEFVRRASEIHNNKYDYSKVNYAGYDKPVTIICPDHGEFDQPAGSHLAGNGCPVCSESHLEKKIAGVLNKHGFSFERQKKFSWLGRMSLDFFLPDTNTAIECQGTQHYSDYYFNKWKYSSLDEIVKRDEIKNRLCRENNVNVLYFSKSNDVFKVSTIYNEKNTFTSVESLIGALTAEKPIKLSEEDLKEIITSTVRKILDG